MIAGGGTGVTGIDTAFKFFVAHDITFLVIKKYTTK
jgi:hypothetical protein